MLKPKIRRFFHTARWAYFENLVPKILYIVFFAFPPTLNHGVFPCFSFLVLWQNFYVNVEKIKYRSYIAIGFSFELSAYSRDHLVSFWSISRKLRPSKYLWNDDKYSTPVNVAKLCCHCIGWNIWRKLNQIEWVTSLSYLVVNSYLKVDGRLPSLPTDHYHSAINRWFWFVNPRMTKFAFFGFFWI